MIFDKSNCPYFETKCNDLACPCAKYKAFLDVKNPEIIRSELLNLNIDDSWNSFKKILYVQKHFASRFHPVKNLRKEETDYWSKEYCICLEDEIEEIFDYIALDDNKPAKVDIVELKKEIVDVLHFVLDLIICGECSSEAVLNNYKLQYLQKEYSANDPLIDIFNHSIQRLENIFDIKRNAEYDNYKQIWNFGRSKTNWNGVLRTLILRLLLMNREIRQQISWKHWKKLNKDINYTKLYQVYANLFYYFMLLSAFIFDDMEEIVNFYLKKNIENIRRQKYNY